MALRATGTLTHDRRSANPGDVVTFTVKLENTTATPETVRFEAEATNVRPPFPLFAREGAVEVPGKTRRALAFTWVAGAPEPGAAKTLRGEARLVNAATGTTVARAPFDIYVAAPSPNQEIPPPRGDETPI